YAALLHCWGKEQKFITTRATLQERKKGILWQSIPKTFQDSILFALKLGIGNIWVDSLCIDQDDINDWEVELSKRPISTSILI
ncbi:heterokaryon incompatibility, partial [Patellaria atrata CBS 101060]